MKRMVLVLWVFLGVVVLAGCNTVQGVGRDLEKAGEAVQRAGSR
jgi:predicted small secreted protein